MPPQAHPWLREIAESDAVRRVGDALTGAGGTSGGEVQRVVADGARGGSTALLAGALAWHTGRTVLLVVAHLDEADDALEDLELFAGEDYGVEAVRFGALEVLPGESGVNLELLGERLGVVQMLAQDTPEHPLDHPRVIIAPIQALMQAVPEPDAVGDFSLTLSEGLELAPGELIHWLGAAGYQRQDAIDQPGDFAVRGGIIDISPPAGTLTDPAGRPAPAAPVRVDYFGDEVDTLRRIDTETMGSGAKVKSARLIGATAEQIQSDDRSTSLMTLLPGDALVVMHELMELNEQARGYFERLTDQRGVYAPKTVFRKLTGHPHAEVNQYSPSKKFSKRDTKLTLPVHQLGTFDQDAETAVRELGELAGGGEARVLVLCRKPAERDRLSELLDEFAPQHKDKVRIDVASLHHGFVWGGGSGQGAEGPRGQEEGRGQGAQGPRGRVKNQDAANSPHSAPGPLGPLAPLHLVPHHELFHRYETSRRVRRVTTGLATQGSDAFLDLEVGDPVVHVDHGIARFTGLKTMRRQGVSSEYLTLEFAGKSLLHVPATQIDLIQKYVGGFQGRPPLSTLGGKRWAKQKEQVAEAVKDLAAELLRVHAARETQPGIRYPSDTAWQKEFEAEFPYEETDDQLAAIQAIKRDMGEDQPMDRLVCGDVGFGKTEVAIRAAFKAAEYGKQVAVLVPTTVLAEQHERTFKARMRDYPFRIESLSRFKAGKEARAILEDARKGRVDILIGTHRILSEDIAFADLGMVIIDEEQRFGVEHKQKLLSFRLTADVLTLTATPIPRTLHMSMVGLRDISSLTTAPVDRRAIVTEVIPYDQERVKQALVRELGRDGQAFFVHNRVHNIYSVAGEIQKLVPEARIVVGHGQMTGKELEKVMLRFMRREADILVSTTIIESGIDIPTANTMFINEADHYGLADLHQLRGRVGRYKHRAYCYMLLPPDRSLTETAMKRLKAIESYSMLGAGFKIAMRDLEIRGAGNLLGAEQSGHIAAVGYEMYCLLLEQATKNLKSEQIVLPAKTHLELPITGNLPKRYVPADKHRMDAYRRLSKAATLAELESVVQDLTDAYGKPPEKAQALIDLMEIRIAASTLGVETLKLAEPDLIFTVQKTSRLGAVLENAPGRVTVLDEQTVYYRPPPNYLDPQSLLPVLRKLLVRPVQEHQPAGAS